jgi:hypothetical protein
MLTLRTTGVGVGVGVGVAVAVLVAVLVAVPVAVPVAVLGPGRPVSSVLNLCPRSLRWCAAAHFGSWH